MLAIQEEVLHLTRLSLVAHAHGEGVVEVLLAGAHAPDIQRGIWSHGHGRALDVVIDDDRNRWYDVKSGQSIVVRPAPSPTSTGPYGVQRLSRMLGAEEDRQPTLGDLTGQLEV